VFNQNDKPPKVNMMEDEMTVEFQHSGYYIDKNKSLEYDVLLKKINFQTEKRVMQSVSSGFFSVLYGAIEEVVIKIIVPSRDIRYNSVEYQALKNWLHKWEPELVPQMETFEKQFLQKPFIIETTEQKKIPVKSLTFLHHDGVLLEFLSTGRGMSELRSRQLDDMLKSLPYETEFYNLHIRKQLSDGSAVQIRIPRCEIAEQTSYYLALKKFIETYDPTVLDTLNAYEEEIISSFLTRKQS
jgi:hypothetical protein